MVGMTVRHLRKHLLASEALIQLRTRKGVQVSLLLPNSQLIGLTCVTIPHVLEERQLALPNEWKHA